MKTKLFCIGKRIASQPNVADVFNNISSMEKYEKNEHTTYLESTWIILCKFLESTDNVPETYGTHIVLGMYQECTRNVMEK